MTGTNVAVIVPCHNEERTIADVVAGFREALPGCEVVVVDNASTDATAERAAEAGARVIFEPRPGKGNAVRRLFADVEAQCYVMVDGDATYDAGAAPVLVSKVLDEGIDMVVGARVAGPGAAQAYRAGHRFGNALLTWVFQRLFGLRVEDTLSGYRGFSRRFVKTFPSMASGFEIEAELNAHAASVGVTYDEVRTAYGSRPEGSESKLSTYRDGVRILRRNLRLFRDWKPFASFTGLAVPWALGAVALLVPVLTDYVHTGLVPRYPSLIAAVGCFLVALNLVMAGAILERTTRNRIEAVRLAYLRIPAPRRTPVGVEVPAPEVSEASANPRR
ncbi:glycosyltransferase family 2 protein [Oryzihumus sp.]|uniref:glycosyltransferase family 2 protein n=1 Tax=Oryzihumus sp. TaxID=1968903 RepID=UPI002ED98496